MFTLIKIFNIPDQSLLNRIVIQIGSGIRGNGPDCAQLRYINANDGSCEGIDYLDKPAFSVQFHPEAAAGPLDTGFLFDRFVEMIDANLACNKDADKAAQN